MATVYVSPTGSDSNTYVQAQSSATPWLTIGKCQTSATTGDTIIVMAGTHTWGNVTFTKNFTIQGQTADPTLYILDAATSSISWDLSQTGLTHSYSYLTFYRNTYAGANAIFRPPGSGGTLTLTIGNCIFDTCQVGATDFRGIIGGGSAAWNGVITINRCLFKKITHTNQSTVTGMFEANASGGTLTYAITGCTFYWESGLTNACNNVAGYTSAVDLITFKNCIMKNDTGSTINVCPTANRTIGKYSDFHNMTNVSTGTGTTSNITSDPLFVDAANGNFNLRPTSPCIGTGTLT